MRNHIRVSNVLKEPVVFFCKDCNAIVNAKPLGNKFVYKCAVCGTKNVAFGTEESIRNFYRIEKEKKVKNDNEKKDILKK